MIFTRITKAEEEIKRLQAKIDNLEELMNIINDRLSLHGEEQDVTANQIMDEWLNGKEGE